MKTMSIAFAALLALAAAIPAGATCGRTHHHCSGSRVSRDPAPMAQPSAVLPSDAETGECFARVVHPAEYRTVSENVVREPASERIRIIPAVYENVSEQVLVKPATTRFIEVPAEYESVSRDVQIEPSRQEWRRGACNAKAIVDHATGECWCLVEVPAVFQTVSERAVSSPATTRTVDVPAEYATVQKRVLVEAEREERTPVPAVLDTVMRRELVAPESEEWVRMTCDGVVDDRDDRQGTDLWSFPRPSNRVH